MKKEKVMISSEELANMIDAEEINIDNNEDAGSYMCDCRIMC